MEAKHAACLMAMALVPNCADGEEIVELAVQGSLLVYHDGGYVEIVDPGGAPIVVHGVAVVTMEAFGTDGYELSTDGRRARSHVRSQGTDALGASDRLEVTVSGKGGEPDLVWRISAYPEGGFYTFRVGVRNGTDQEVRVAKTSALRVRGATGGALYLGQDPSRHRILDNGSLTVFDYMVEVVPGDVERDDVAARMIPGDFAGASISNWNHAVADLDGTATWVAGGLTFETAMPILNLTFDPRYSSQAPDGRRAFSYFSAEGAYLPLPRPVAAGRTLDSELFYVHPAEPDALVGLERYAERVAANLGVVPWTRRDGGRRVPGGWNSWSGSSGTGGYGTDIDEAVILDNLDVMATELRDWGMDWFQIDDGYEPAYGDWTWREDRFPHGPAWLADEIRARGLRPGLWMAPFTPSAGSQLVADHPDWIADWTPLGDVIAGDDCILDLTHPEVLEYLDELFATFIDDWGFEWFKMDFAYWALLGTGFHDPTSTREEAWHGAVDIVRDRLGPDTFFLAISASGLNYQHADSVRITLDSMPIWDHQPELSDDDHMNQQGLKPTVRNAGRRWYLQDRIWVNHPDLIFFRSNALDPTWPAITLEESQAFCTFVALSGGIVKLGDRLVDLDADAINTIRALLPIYGRSARPIDVLTAEYPEVWVLPVEPLDGLDEDYVLVGLFNWGKNVDMGTTPYTPVPDDGSARHHEVDLDALGLTGEWLAYEFWGQEYIGPVSGTLSRDVLSHTAQVIALRRPTGAPRLLGWNRQITMGGTLLEQAAWDGASRTLTISSRVAAPTATAPFTYGIAVLVPDGHAFSSIASTGVPVTGLAAAPDPADGQVLRVSFVPDATGDLTLTLSF